MCLYYLDFYLDQKPFNLFDICLAEAELETCCCMDSECPLSKSEIRKERHFQTSISRLCTLHDIEKDGNEK